MIPVNSQFCLDHFSLADEAQLAIAINDVEIARNTLAIPFLYILEDAQWWLQQTELQRLWVIKKEVSSRMVNTMMLYSTPNLLRRAINYF